MVDFPASYVSFREGTSQHHFREKASEDRAFHSSNLGDFEGNQLKGFFFKFPRYDHSLQKKTMISGFEKSDKKK